MVDEMFDELVRGTINTWCNVSSGDTSGVASHSLQVVIGRSREGGGRFEARETTASERGNVSRRSSLTDWHWL